ncbi:hypothetical protein [Ilumatobacter nonamiensis]|uniref:hypothetical protein n=1 Tax=Ilumatobacter nonamiensis TaxID=467093 RepID=UPI000349928D|nr:hypothetical protein [Ilumatobacter nonamiensis]
MENDLGLRDIARVIAPDAEIATTSNPEPVLRAYNVVGVFNEEQDSRDAVLALESIDADDAAIGLVTLGHVEHPTGIQPEDRRITGETLRRAGIGAAIGAVISALVIGLGALAFSTSTVAIGGAIGGALFGAFIGGLWGAFVKFGGSDAYRQSFGPDDRATTLVSLHTDSRDHAQEARSLMGLIAGTTPTMVRRDEQRVWAED